MTSRRNKNSTSSGKTKRLSDLQAGENVRVQRGETWQPAVVLHRHDQLRSYVVRTPDGRQYRRKPFHLPMNRTLTRIWTVTQETNRQHTHVQQRTQMLQTKQRHLMNNLRHTPIRQDLVDKLDYLLDSESNWSIFICIFSH